jgi:hypothetical protein
MVHTTKTITYNKWVYDQPGETFDEHYYVGDQIKTIWRNGGGVSGRIIEIIIDEEKDLYQVKVDNGWCTHPNNGDLITVIKPYNKKEAMSQ